MKAEVVIRRIESGDQGTFGQLWTPGLGLYSGELPWFDNKSNISCIPGGFYRCGWTWSPRFRRMMYLLFGAEPRLGIRKHAANLMGAISMGFRAQLNGCIALGEKLGWIEGQKAILLSAPAMRRFEGHMGHRSFLVEIRECSTS